MEFEIVQTPQTMSFTQLTALQWGQFARRRSNWLVLFLFACAGLYALYQGYAGKWEKTETIQAFRQEKDSLLQDMVTGINADTLTMEGKATYEKSSRLSSGLWNTKLPSYKLPVSTAIYNIGQSDVFTYYYLFSAENFEMQLLKQTEITNPLRALAGHFDVSFWMIYLLPLFILLLTFHALSAERDNGNWRLIAAQGISEKRWLQSRFAVVAFCCFVLMAVVAVTGTIINLSAFKQGIRISDVLYFFIAAMYLLFWLCLFYYINSLRKSTAYHALVSGTAWISICLVLPVLISKLTGVIVPVDNTKISTFSRRPQNTQIEENKIFAAHIIQQFSGAAPLYKNADADTAAPEFYLRTYHALHYLLHGQRWPVIQQYFAAIERRQQLTNWSTILNPAGSSDGLLTALADNDAAAYHHFILQTENMHTDLHNVFYPTLFSNHSFTPKEYNQLPQFRYQRSGIPASLPGYVLLIAAISIGLVSVSNRRLKNTYAYGVVLHHPFSATIPIDQ